MTPRSMIPDIQTSRSSFGSVVNATLPEVPRLVICDLRSQSHYRAQLGSDGNLNKPDRAARGLFLTRPSSADLCVLREDYDRSHIDWLWEVGLGPHPSQIHFVATEESGSKLLSSSPTLSRAVGGQASSMCIVPFYVGPDEELLADKIGAKKPFGSGESIGMFFNDKVLNKRLCTQLGLPTVAGYVTDPSQSLDEKVSTALGMLQSAGDIIIRTSQGSGGGGIVIVKGQDPDASVKIATFFENKNQSGICLVEQFLSVSDSLNIQFGVSSSSLTFIGMSAQLLAEGTKHEGNLGGYGFTANRIPQRFEDAVDMASRLARKGQDMGYEGILGFDFIVTESGETFCIETNARINGSTIVYQVVHEVVARHEDLVEDLSWVLLTLDTPYDDFEGLAVGLRERRLPLLTSGELSPGSYVIPIEHVGGGQWSILLVNSEMDGGLDDLLGLMRELED